MAIDTDTRQIAPAAGFWARVVKQSNGCWAWTGQITSDGYGRFGKAPRPDGLSHVAHRYAFQTMVGPVSSEVQVDHLCHDPEQCAGGDDCPHRRCVNPEHLAAVTPRANALRSNGIAAINAAKTACPAGHPLAGANLRLDGRKRRCVTCRKEQVRRASREYQRRRRTALR